MNKAAIFIRHQALPGQREEVRKVWERHMQPLIAEQGSRSLLSLLRRH